MLGHIICFFGGHTPNRRKVGKDIDGKYIGHCARCGAPIRRRKRDDWVRDWRNKSSRTPVAQSEETPEAEQ